jgi:tetratricopeptide (TPR) repeat protein
MIAMREQITSKVRQGLLPLFGVTGEVEESGTRPTNQEAYDLYLRTTAMSRDAQPNKDAITMLERAVGLDPMYAPAWQTLGLRYYLDSEYSTGGEEAFQKSNAAFERALALDPNLIFAASQLITHRVERGDLVKAYWEANALLKRRPQDPRAHFTLAYVDRYAGFLDESTHECDESLRLDPRDYLIRSCAWSFLSLGRTSRARQFLQLDPGSEWTRWVTVEALLRERKMNEAREAVKRMSTAPEYSRDFFEAVVGLRSPSELDRMSQDAIRSWADRFDDPEDLYQKGAVLAFASKQEAAVYSIRKAIEKNYCAYSALENDPLLDSLRDKPEFADLLKAARLCQEPLLVQQER